jgi:hypothetical protein
LNQIAHRLAFIRRPAHDLFEKILFHGYYDLLPHLAQSPEASSLSIIH